MKCFFCLTQARDADARGNNEAARSNGRIALALNFGGLVAWVLFIVSVIIVIALTAFSSRSNVCYGSNSSGRTYSYYCYK